MGPNGEDQLPWVLEKIMDWPEGGDFEELSEELTCAEEVPL